MFSFAVATERTGSTVRRGVMTSPAGASQISRAVTEHAAGGQGNPRNAAQNFPSPRSGRHRRFENVGTSRRTDLSNKPELCRPLRGLVCLWGVRVPGVPSASSASVTARLPCVVPSGLNRPAGDNSTERPETNPRRRHRQSENALVHVFDSTNGAEKTVSHAAVAPF